MDKKIIILLIIMATTTLSRIEPVNAVVWSNFTNNVTIEIINNKSADSHQDELILFNATGLSFGTNQNCTTSTLLADNQSTVQLNRTIVSDEFGNGRCLVAFILNKTIANNADINVTLYFNNTNSTVANQTLNTNGVFEFFDNFQQYGIGNNGTALTNSSGQWDYCFACGNLSIVSFGSGQGLNFQLRGSPSSGALIDEYFDTANYSAGNTSMKFKMRVDSVDNGTLQFGFVSGNGENASGVLNMQVAYNATQNPGTQGWVLLGGLVAQTYTQLNGTSVVHNLSLVDRVENQSYRFYHGNITANETGLANPTARSTIEFQVSKPKFNITIDDVMIWRGNDYGENLNGSTAILRNTTSPAIGPTGQNPPNIKTLTTIPTTPKWNQSTLIQTNVTDANTVNVTVRYPNGSIVATNATTNFNLQLLSFVADQANSTKHNYTINGTYNVTVVATNSSNSLITYSNITFVISDISGGSSVDTDSNISGNSIVNQSSIIQDSMVENSNISNSNKTNSINNLSNVYNSVEIDSITYKSNISNSNKTNSNNTQSDIRYCDETNSQAINATLANCTLSRSNLINVTWADEDGIIKFEDANVTNNIVYLGNITWRGYLFDTGVLGAVNLSRIKFKTFVIPIDTDLAPDPAAENFSINYSVFQLSSQPATIYINITNLINTTFWRANFSVQSFTINHTVYNASRPYGVILNITTVGSPSNGTYDINTTFNTSVYGQTYWWKENLTNIANLTMWVSPPAGDIDASLANGTFCSGTICDNDTTMRAGESITLNYQMNNTGGFALSDCKSSISGWSDTSFVTFNPSDGFSININSSTTYSVTYKPTSSLGKQTGKLEIDCRATSGNGRNKLTAQPDNAPDLGLIVLTSTGQAQGPVGGAGPTAPITIQPSKKNVGDVCSKDSDCSSLICDIRVGDATKRTVCLLSNKDACGNAICNDGQQGRTNRGENAENCRADCGIFTTQRFSFPPVLLILLGLLIITVVAIALTGKEKKKSKQEVKR